MNLVKKAACSSVFAALIFLNGCVQPVTQYQYLPPQTEKGKMCINSCKQIGQQCQKTCPPSDPTCKCTIDYRACYQLCGGKVVEERVWETD